MEIETELEGVKMKAGGNGLANRLLHTLLHIYGRGMPSAATTCALFEPKLDGQTT